MKLHQHHSCSSEGHLGVSLIQEEGLFRPSDLLDLETSDPRGFWFWWVRVSGLVVAIVGVDHLGHVMLSGYDAESPPRTWLYFDFSPPCFWADPTREVLRRRAPPGWAILKHTKKKKKNKEMKQQRRSSTVVTKQRIRRF